MFFGFLYHAIDIALRKTIAILNRDIRGLLSIEVFGRNFDDTIDVNGEFHFNARFAATCRTNSGKLEVSEQFVIVGHWTFALVDHDINSGLIVFRRGEDLALLRWNRGIALDKRGHNAAQGFNAEGKRGDIEKNDIFDIPSDNGPLNRRTSGNRFIRVDREVNRTTRNLLYHFLNGWHTGRATDHQDIGKVRIGESSIVHRFFHRNLATFK